MRTCCNAGSSSVTASTLASFSASSQTIPTASECARRYPTCAPSSRRTRERRRHRCARARSPRGPSRGCCVQGARRCRPCYSAGQEAVRVRAHTLVGIGPRHFGPAFLRLDQVGGARAPSCDRLPPELRDRSARLQVRLRLEGGCGRLGHALSLDAGGRGSPIQGETRKSRRSGVSCSVRWNTLCPCVRPGTDPQLRPRVDTRRPCAGDEACRATVRRLLPALTPRVLDADQAEALVPDARP